MKRIIKSLMIIASCGMMAACALPSVESDIVLTMDGSVVTKDRFYESLKQANGLAVAQSTIIKHVLEKHVGEEMADKLYQRAVEERDRQAEQAGGLAQFKEVLKNQRFTDIEVFTDQLYINYLTQEAVSMHITPTEAMLADFYETHYEPEMEVKHILVEDKEKAEKLLKELIDNDKANTPKRDLFEELAKSESIDPSGEFGGRLRPFVKGAMVEPFEEAVRAAKSGAFIDHVVETEFGFHVIYVIRNGEKLPLNDVYDDVSLQFVQFKQNDVYFTYEIISNLVKNSDLQTSDPLFERAIEGLSNLTQTTLEVKE